MGEHTLQKSPERKAAEDQAHSQAADNVFADLLQHLFKTGADHEDAIIMGAIVAVTRAYINRTSLAGQVITVRDVRVGLGASVNQAAEALLEKAPGRVA